MKRTIKGILLITIIGLLMIGLEAKAASANLSVSSNNVTEGDSFTTTIQVNDSAAWHVVLTSAGPVENCSLNEAGDSGDGTNTNKSFSVTCKATGTGTISLSLSGDVSIFNESTLKIEKTIISGSATVNVSAKPSPSPSQTTTPKPTTTTSSESKPKESDKSTPKSTNNKVKEIIVNDEKATKVDDTHYSITVGNGITKANIKVTPEDTKAKATGTGEKSLKIGENKFEINITSESGNKNTIILTVTRRESATLEDLEDVLQEEGMDEVDIVIEKDSIISVADMDRIKESQKTVIFNKFDDNKKLEYSWEIDGKQLTDENVSFDTSVSTTTPNKDRILELSKAEDGFFIHTNHKKEYPAGVKLKMYVGDKFKDGWVNIYYYDEEEDKLVELVEKRAVVDGYVEIEVEKGGDYFLEKAEVLDDEVTAGKKDSSIMLFVILGILGVLLVGIIIYFATKKKKPETVSTEENETLEETPTPTYQEPIVEETPTPSYEEPQPVESRFTYQGEESISPPETNEVPAQEEVEPDSEII